LGSGGLCRSHGLAIDAIDPSACAARPLLLRLRPCRARAPHAMPRVREGGIVMEHRLVRGLVQSPAILGAIAAVLLIDWLLLPCNNADRSVAGSWHGCERSTLHGRPVRGGAYRAGDRLIWAFEGDPHLAPPAGAAATNITVFVDVIRRDGWWALTRKSQRYHVWDEAGATMTGEALEEVQRALVEFRRASGEWPHLDRVLDLVESGRTSEVSRLPMGYFHNVISGSLGAAFLACAIVQSRRFVARMRSSRWTAHGRCSRCGYPLDPSLLAPCPECGLVRAGND
jgi:hypothetical protein